MLSAAILPVPRNSPTASIAGDDNNPWLVNDVCEGSTFFPSVVIGEHETVGRSVIGRADKEIEIWEKVLAAHEKEEPALAPVVEQKLNEAKEKRAQIDETLEENWRIG